MCGISGIYSFKNNDIDYSSLISGMLNEIIYRGPEAINVEDKKNWGIGIARLSIVDLSNKRNIFKAADGKITFVVNGEIFNHKELRQELIKKGYKFQSHCDSEVVGFLYEEYGIDFINKMNGQFGIAIFDERSDKVILIRDHFGIAPLFYHFDGNSCYFASELAAFKPLERVKKEFNPEALEQLFTFWTVIGKTTFLKDVYQVRHSHYVEISRNGIIEKPYYELDLSKEKIDKSLSFEDAKKQVRDMLMDAVKIRLEASDVEVGSYLSGGIDSSVITKITEKLKKDTLQTFSINFSDPLYTEKKYQEELISTTKVTTNRIDIEYEDIFDNFEETIEHTGQPIFRTAPVPLFKLSELVNKKNIKVVLTGEGADEVFWGYDTFKELKIRKFWSKQPRSKFRPLLFKKIFSQFPQFGEKYHAFISAFYKKDLLSKDREFYSHLPRWNNGIPLKAMFSNELKENLKDYDCIEELRKQLPSNFDNFSDLSKCQYIEMETLLPGYLLSSQGDRMTFANSVESRIPFLDRRLVELCATLPKRYKMRSFIDKYILREAFKDILPASIYKRPKQAYQAPEITAFVKGAKGSYVEHMLSEEVTEKIGLFDPRRINVLYNKVINVGDVSRVSTQNNMALIQVLSTHIFYSKYIENVY